MLPSQIPLGLWTHLNVAFGAIDPSTFAYTAMAGVDDSVVASVSNLKASDPNLKVYISVGGWAANDPGPTYDTFSQLAASPDAQQTFINSLISFMVSNNLDGVDIDW